MTATPALSSSVNTGLFPPNKPASNLLAGAVGAVGPCTDGVAPGEGFAAGDAVATGVVAVPAGVTLCCGGAEGSACADKEKNAKTRKGTVFMLSLLPVEVADVDPKRVALDFSLSGVGARRYNVNFQGGAHYYWLSN